MLYGTTVSDTTYAADDWQLEPDRYTYTQIVLWHVELHHSIQSGPFIPK